MCSVLLEKVGFGLVCCVIGHFLKGNIGFSLALHWRESFVVFFFPTSDTVSGHTLEVLQALSECVRVYVSPTNISKSHHPLHRPPEA